MMTIASALTALNTDIQNARTAITNKGGTVTSGGGSSQLATDIATIPTGSSPVISSLNVTPTTSQQTITASGGVDGYSPITVNAVTSSIDNNITAGNIKSGVSILGVTGNYTGATLTTKNITQNGTYNASSDNADGYSSVTVNVSGGGGTGITREVLNGVYQMPTTNFTFSLPSNATDVGSLAFYYAFYGCSGLTSLDLSSLTTVSGSQALTYAFQNCSGLTSVDLSSLTTVSGKQALYYAFHGCSGLTSVDLSSLTTVSGSYAFYYAFYGCTRLTGSLDLSSLTTVSGSQALYYAFQNCSRLTSLDLSSLTTVSGSQALAYAFHGCIRLTGSLDLSSLTTVSGSQALAYAFYGCTRLTDIYFRALTTSSFGSSYKNQFSDMMSNTGGIVTHTLHFPSNLQSTISGLTGYPLFGGTSGYVVLAYDLPATS
jgi:uncharacterized ParB-like nuclease family protein